MIAAVKAQGSSFRGIVNYLLGPGRSDEHVDQRVVATSRDVDVRLGVMLDDEERRALSAQLGLWPAMFPTACPAKGEVYHAVFSLPAGEELSDDQWGEVAGGLAALLHLERPSGPTASWAAFRHGPSAEGYDHMHFVASLVRSDGSEVKTYMPNGFAALHQMVRRMEQQFGLTPLVGPDHGSVPAPQRGEREACARRGRPEPERSTLARTVRAAAGGAANEAEFLEGLRAAGVLCRPRYAEGSRTEVVGYSVAMKPPEGGQPVWFGGGRLARDLTLPKLREQWDPLTAAQRDEARRRWQGRRPPAGLTTESSLRAIRRQTGEWSQAAQRLHAASAEIAARGQLGPSEWRGVARHAAAAAGSLARRLEPDGRGDLAVAADVLARCAQRPVARHVPVSPNRAMRGVVAVCAQHRMAGAPEGWLRVVLELARLAETLARVAEARDDLVQRTAMARQAAAALHAAQVRLADQPPPGLVQPPPRPSSSLSGSDVVIDQPQRRQPAADPGLTRPVVPQPQPGQNPELER
jgi:hypothetical protein